MSSNTPKIAIAGQQGAGKDTLIDILIRYSSGQWGVVDTADALLDVYCARVGLTREQVLKDKQKHRRGFQALGDEIERDRQAGLLKYAFAKRALIDLDYGGTIFSSVRRPSEWHYLKQNGYKLVLVEADRDIRAERRGGLSGTNHNTEDTCWIRREADYIIQNNGSIEALEDEANRMLNVFKF